MARYQTPRAKITGLGAAGHGAHHYLVQRVTALALLVLVPLVLLSFLAAFSSGYEAVRIWVGSLFGSITLLALMSAMFWHLRLGVQVALEDYFGGTARMLLLLVNTFGCFVLWLIAVLSILRVFFEG
ncbi:MAG: succinate dehydrogenase, hydrophobic membrane anchor protein [Robiginitomaculum sp.]|nr:MAG: succinate dehydrogenase, hydrophobic membrane anchor protein [Robiginitomaculum sp.]